MSQDIFEHCKEPFSRFKNRKNQNYCSKQECQNTRKAKWKREKTKIDPEFKQCTLQVNRDWRSMSEGYYKEYRKRNPEKAERSRILQRVRNEKRKTKGNVNGRRYGHRVLNVRIMFSFFVWSKAMEKRVLNRGRIRTIDGGFALFPVLSVS